MAMMIIKDIKLFGGLMYIISWLSNHLIYYRHIRKLTQKYIWNIFGS